MTKSKRIGKFLRSIAHPHTILMAILKGVRTENEKGEFFIRIKNYKIKMRQEG